MTRRLDPATLFAALTRMPGATSLLGIEVEFTDAEPICRMTLTEKHQGAPGVAHGGVVATLLDSALGVRAVSHAIGRGLTSSTVELKTNFLRPALIGQTLEARTTMVSAGKSLLVASGTVRALETGEQVAFAVGTFNLYPLGPEQQQAMRAVIDAAERAT